MAKKCKSNCLRALRILFAVVFFLGITFLFLDFTGIAAKYLDFMAKVQFLPAVLALNFAIVLGLLVLTFLFGRIYCSVICPMGIFQDIFNRLGRKVKKNSMNYRPNHPILRGVALAIFAVGSLLGFTSIVGLIAPYSAFGRIATYIFNPIYKSANNILAHIAEAQGSFAFYEVDVYMKACASLFIAIATFVIIGVLAFKKGRLFCNTICPVGTVNRTPFSRQ